MRPNFNGPKTIYYTWRPFKVEPPILNCEIAKTPKISILVF
jgi:hypothetical protein